MSKIPPIVRYSRPEGMTVNSTKLKQISYNVAVLALQKFCITIAYMMWNRVFHYLEHWNSKRRHREHFHRPQELCSGAKKKTLRP